MSCQERRGEHVGIEEKARGGYVIVPPSQVGGKRYRLVACRARSGGLDWAAVTRLLNGERQVLGRPTVSANTSANLGRLAAWVEQLPEGNRNNGLFWAACRAAESGQPGTLDDIAAAAARTGLTSREITRTIASAKREVRRANPRHFEREATR